ncbi:hypothetical protein JCM10449v2_006673 [Rhodotorula kratochvilovae]
MDALVSTAARQPLAFTTPSSSFSQSRLDKGRPVSMALASSSTPVSLPPAAKSATSANGFPFLAPATPSSPDTPAAFGLTTTAPPSHDEHMVDAFVTPPPATRSSAPHATSGVRATLSPLSLDSSPSNGRLPSKKMKSKLLQSPSDTMPLTPPLTPPYDQHPSLPTGLAAPASPSPPPKPATVSARALQHHRLHPLFAATYTLCEELGSGGFGFVVRAERNHDGLSVAVKFIERAKIPSHAWVKSRSWGDTPGLTQPSGPKLVPMEAFVLRSIRHEGVVAFIDLFEDDKYFYLVMEHHGTPWQIPDKHAADVSVSTGPSSSAMAPTLTSSWPRLAPGQQQTLTPTSSPTTSSTLLPSPTSPSPNLLAPPRPAPMERRSSCDLFECIEQYSRFDEATAKYVFAQIVEIVYALGQMGICHRDLKDENLAIDNKFRVKLIDFGSAVIFDPRQPSPLYQRFHGTQSFASAEILRGEAYQAPPSEVWSLGVLLSILITGECPFADADAAKVGRISRPKIRLNPEVEHLLHACLDIDVKQRITISQIRRHPWLSALFHTR